MHTHRSRFRGILAGSCGVSAVVFATVCVILQLLFGGISAGLAWANGNAVYIEPRTIEMDADPGSTVTVPFRVRKLINKPVTIVGGSPGCGCITLSGLPLELSSAAQEFKVNFAANKSKAGQVVMQNIPLHLNVDSAQVVISIKARVRDGMRANAP